MVQIPDDPIIRCIERTGYPPWWHQPDYPDSMFTKRDDDDFYDDDEEEEDDGL